MTNRGQGWYVGAARLLKRVGATGLLVLGVAATAPASAQTIEKPRGDDEKAAPGRDAKLEKQVETRFEKDAVLKAQGLDVTVISGKVTLTGTTGTEKDKAFAAKVAHSVKGVSEVDNQILVRGSKEAAKPAGDRGKSKPTRKTDEPTPSTAPPTDTDRAVPPESPPRENERGVPPTNPPGNTDPVVPPAESDRDAPPGSTNLRGQNTYEPEPDSERQKPERAPAMPEPVAPPTDIAPVNPDGRWPQKPPERPEPGSSDQGKTSPPPPGAAQTQSGTQNP